MGPTTPEISRTSECTDEIKARYLKSDMCLWRNMPTVVHDYGFTQRESERGVFDDELQFL